ncbi:MAG: FAD-dependent oxidoreductase [Alphaproteobacteria bacterium]|jgi:predicted NAD/FAD-binding protein|nr:FAD-dependent oxidoreductase [Alphaproteobacteria bacterium]
MSESSLRRRGNGALHIGVIGSGISGLSAAWTLSQAHHVTLIEREARLGGHSNTVDVRGAAGAVPVDTGFIVYNPVNYPNLVALFDHLGVETQPSDMSFAASIDDGAFEYSGGDLAGLVAQPTNLLRPRFWRMLRDILRFYGEAPAVLDPAFEPGLTLGDYLSREGYGESFLDDHLLPMAAAIWSTDAPDVRQFPLRSFVRFCASHGLLKLRDRPQWRTVTGGSRRYVERLAAGISGEIRLGCGVRAVRRGADGVIVTDETGAEQRFDQIVLATHADISLRLLADAGHRERAILGAFRYQSNTAVLHHDPALMPRRRRAWSSWNYVGQSGRVAGGPLCVTYWMNRLQRLQGIDELFVTLNPDRPIAADRIVRTIDYAHPVFDLGTEKAQAELGGIQGLGGIWHCGAWAGWGFHEDGLQSGLAVAEAIGGVRRPWNVANESGRLGSLPPPRAAAMAAA